MDERAKADLAAIKGRVQAVRDAIKRGDPEVSCGMQFTYGQLRLHDVVADEWGRLWRVDRGRLTLIGGKRAEPGIG